MGTQIYGRGLIEIMLQMYETKIKNYEVFIQIDGKWTGFSQWTTNHWTAWKYNTSALMEQTKLIGELLGQLIQKRHF